MPGIGYPTSYDYIEWSNGDTIEGITIDGSLLTPDSTYTYWVLLTDTNTSCTRSDTILITVNYSSGFEDMDIELQSFIKLYPNPTNGIVNLEISQGNEDMIIEVMDIIGQIIYSKQFEINNTKTIEQIDLSNITKGIYFIKIYTGDIIKIEKVVIQ